MATGSWFGDVAGQHRRCYTRIPVIDRLGSRFVHRRRPWPDQRRELAELELHRLLYRLGVRECTDKLVPWCWPDGATWSAADRASSVAALKLSSGDA